MKHRFSFLFYVLVVLLCAVPLFIFFWMVTTGLKTQLDNLAIPPKLIFTPTLGNFRAVFAQHHFLKYVMNSFVVGSCAVLVSLAFGLPAAYSIARFRFYKLGMMVLLVRMVPFISYLIPWFILFRRLQLIDTYISLITTHLIITLPFIVWVMVGFFESLPVELEEAALIDGCGRFQSFLRILVPNVRNGVFTAAVLSFIFSWNQFLFSLILSGTKTMTVPVAVFHFISYEEINWGGLAAAATIITAPPLAFTLLINRYMIKGLTAGAVKG